VLVVNNGSPQRSMVDSLTVIFPSAVTLSSGAITLYNTTASRSESISCSNPSGDGKTWLVTFTGSDIYGGSLPNGVYDLTVYASDVSGISLSSDVTGPSTASSATSSAPARSTSTTCPCSCRNTAATPTPHSTSAIRAP
jgi:hypothetical protein